MGDSQESRSNGVSAAIARDWAGALEVLRFELMDVVDGKSSLSDLRPTVRQLCILAHSEDVRAEELLVRFKETWASLPALSGLPRGRQRNDLMARVATMCIEEFYGTPSGQSAPHDS
ncbi:MAG: hypothetical protein ACR2L6_08105 [Gemmatimonadaceae bacterium]